MKPPIHATPAAGHEAGVWVGLAALALAAGVALYVWGRPQPAMFLPSGWHRPLDLGPAGAWAGALPTFVHALALPLITAALLRPARRATAAAICVGWCVVEVFFEALQQRAIGAALMAHLPSQAPCKEVCDALAAFARHGTFDPLDIAAAVLASALAGAIVGATAPRHALRSETHHA